MNLVPSKIFISSAYVVYMVSTCRFPNFVNCAHFTFTFSDKVFVEHGNVRHFTDIGCNIAEALATNFEKKIICLFFSLKGSFIRAAQTLESFLVRFTLLVISGYGFMRTSCQCGQYVEDHLVVLICLFCSLYVSGNFFLDSFSFSIWIVLRYFSHPNILKWYLCKNPTCMCSYLLRERRKY